jgi:hypothetical protein
LVTPTTGCKIVKKQSLLYRQEKSLQTEYAKYPYSILKTGTRKIAKIT